MARFRHRAWIGVVLTLAAVGAAAVVLFWPAPSSDASAAAGRSTRQLLLSVSRPADVLSGTEVTVRVRTKDQLGRPIKGVRVAFTWRLVNGTCTHVVWTNALGRASNAHTVHCGPTGVYQARVGIRATWREQLRTRVRYFQVTGEPEASGGGLVANGPNSHMPPDLQDGVGAGL